MNIVVTGASRGIGLELVKLFASKNHQVFALTRNVSELEKMSRENLMAIATDLTDEKSIRDAVEIIKHKVSHVDVLINNAGILVKKEFSQITLQELQQVYQVNVFAPFMLIQQLKSMMGKNSRSHIVNISSIGGFQGSVKFPGLSAYSSSKAALTGLTECLAEEFKEDRIAVNGLALGAVQTEMLAEAFPGYQAPLSVLQMAEYIYDFSLNGQKYFNGKIIPVSLSTP